MIKKVIQMAVKAVIGCFLFYLFATAIVFPLALKWGGEVQGSKLLRHPVKIASVLFDPLFWRLEVNDFKIFDSDGQVMVGFDRFNVDVSFLALFKKEYRIEALALDGLTVNAVLLDRGHVNLMDLVAVPAPRSSSQEKPVSAKTVTSSPAPLPVVVVDAMALRNGRVNILDRSISPNFAISLKDINVRITGLSTKSDSPANIVFKSKLGEKGDLQAEVNFKPLANPLEIETTCALNDFALHALTPYIGKYTGRGLKDGTLGFKMDYRIGGNKLTAAHKVLIQRFSFGQKVESKDALSLPFGLVIALLEDPQGRIKISLPVTGDMSKPDFHYWSLVGQVVTNFFTGLVAKPFAFLASAMGADSGTDELGMVRFLPGQTIIPDAEKEKVRTLIRGLQEHPKLRLEINGGYDVEADWKAIKTEILAKDFAELRRTSTRSDSWIYEMLYQRRAGIRALWDATKKIKAMEGGYDETKVVAEMKKHLIEDGVVDKSALETLAAARAKAVHDFMLTAGLDASRLSTGHSRQEQSSMGFVPLEFTLTVFQAAD